MAFNGSGTFSRTNGTYSGSTVWAQDKNAGRKIVASYHDSHDQDIADGLTGCLTKDGQTTPTANIPLGGYKITNLGAGTARTDAARLATVQDNAVNYLGTVGGTANALTGSLTPSITAYANGQRFVFITAAENTAATPTININGVGAVNMYLDGGSVIPAYYFAAGEVVDIVYSGGSFYLVGHKPPYFKAHTFTLGTQAGSLTGATYTAGVHSAIGKTCTFSLQVLANQITAASAYWTIALPQAYLSTGYDMIMPIMMYRVGRGFWEPAAIFFPSGGGSTARLYAGPDVTSSTIGIDTYTFHAECVTYRTAA